MKVALLGYGKMGKYITSGYLEIICFHKVSQNSKGAGNVNSSFTFQYAFQAYIYNDTLDIFRIQVSRLRGRAF